MKRNLLCSLCLLWSVLLFSAGKNTPVTVASYNLRLDVPSDEINAWPNRKEAVKDLIRFHEFEIIGTQEGFSHQLNDLLEMPGWAKTGVGRDDGADEGEHSAILYRTDRFKLLDSGNFWFSETPDHPSFGWEAKYRRICSWGKFRDMKNKKIFFFFNVHFDHEAPIARRESANLLLRNIREIAGNNPVICTGDFNSMPDDEPIRIISAVLHDACLNSEIPPYGPVTTYQGFDYNYKEQSERIDYHFINDRCEILKYGVLSDAVNGRFPSDHFPVVTKIRIK
ncbi:MAG: endonuclease/exonuclease/phosphatase family protein [Bacteroidales bacterium]|nr:endonuclease/exonuclease/phosphatase family protein [Bacteroidales bacterium]